MLEHSCSNGAKMSFEYSVSPADIILTLQVCSGYCRTLQIIVVYLPEIKAWRLMLYAVADIHGCSKTFRKLLERSGLTRHDTLYLSA